MSVRPAVRPFPPALLAALAFATPVAVQVASAALIPATLVAREGQALTGLSDDNTATVSSLNDPFTTPSGKVGFTGNATNGNFVFFNNAVIWRNNLAPAGTLLTGAEGTMGVGESGEFIYSPSARVDPDTTGRDAVWGEDGLILKATDPAPGLPGVFSSFNSRPQMSADGTAYWVGGTATTATGSTSNRVFWRRTQDGTITPLLVGGQTYGAFTIASQQIAFEFKVSDNNNFRLNVVKISGATTSTDDIVLLNESTAVATEGGGLAGGVSGEAWAVVTGTGNPWRAVSVNNAGNWVIGGDTNQAAASNGVIVYNGTIKAREGTTIGGVAVPAASINGVSINNRNQVAFIYGWGSSTSTTNPLQEVLFFGLGQTLETSAVPVLRIGDELDTNNDGIADYRVTDLTASPTIAPGLDLPDNGTIVVGVVVTDLTTNTTGLDAIIRIGVPAGFNCPPDWNQDNSVNSADITAFLSNWFADRAASPQTTVADFNADGVTNSADITAFLSAWFAARATGC